MSGQGLNPSFIKILSIARALSRYVPLSKLAMSMAVVFSLLSALSELLTVVLIQPIILIFSGGSASNLHLGPIQSKLLLALEHLHAHSRLIIIMGLIVLLQVLKEGFTVLVSLISINIRTKFEFQMRNLVYKKSLKVPMKEYIRTSSGEYYTILNAYPRASASFVYSLISMIPTGIMLGIYAGIMAHAQGWLFLLISGVFVFVMLIMRFTYSIQASLGRKMRDGLTAVASKADELNQALPVIRAFAQEKRAADSYASVAQDYINANAKSDKLTAGLGPLQRASSFILILIALTLFSLFTSVNEKAFFSTIILFIFILTRLNAPMSLLNTQRASLSQTHAFISALIKFLVHPEERVGGVTPEPLKSLHFNQVNFSYEKDETVLKNISFTIHQGELIGLVGPSGAGKTTLINLIAGFESPTSGMMQLNQQDMCTLNLKHWRQRTAIVPQKPYMFDMSIKDNIRYGCPHASDEEVVRAAELANAASFIEKLPHGYESRTGEGGNLLSGGQIQRLAIARALLVKPDLLILDEATSAQDTGSEYIIRETLNNLRGRLTVIVIAHRLSTIVSSDRIFVLNKGELVQAGSHDELLLNKNGLYSKLCAFGTLEKVEGLHDHTLTIADSTI